MLTKRERLMLIGTVLVAFGIFMFFKSTSIISFGFFRFAQVSTGGILIALILLDVILLVATQHKATKIALPILIAMLVVSMILGTRLSFHGSLLDMFLMLVPAAIGVGLLLRAVMLKKS